ncbi:MAG: hypothetical protein HZB91_00975 [Elusimicrobia bacterium]|nr:hypothetical protein [Elusimicrobiota bacterium]
MLRERTDFDGNALASLSGPPDDPKTRFEIHTVFPRDNHEIIHVLLFEKGLPLAMWAEGIAVCRSGSWHGKRLAEAARTVVESRASLASLLDDTRFRADEMVSYPLAGAFAEFLIERHGIGAFLDSYEGLARSGPDVSRAGIDQVLLAVYGESFKRSESLFRRWLWAARRKKGDAGS